MDRYAGPKQEEHIKLDKHNSFFFQEISMYHENKENLHTIKVQNRSYLMKRKTAKLFLRELIIWRRFHIQFGATRKGF